MQIAVFGGKKGSEHEKENARKIGRQLAKNGMGPLFADVSSGLAQEVAWGAREQNERMLIIGTLPTERNSDHTKITFAESPYSATYFTSTSNKIRSCSSAIFIGNGPDVLEALLIAYNRAPEGFIIGILDDENSLSQELAALEIRTAKETSVIRSADPTTLVNSVFNEVMRSHAKARNETSEKNYRAQKKEVIHMGTEEREGVDASIIFKKFGVLITDGHFRYTRGEHGTAYINKDALYPHTREVSLLCRSLAEKLAGPDINVVVGPEKGGIVLSHLVAHHLTEILGSEVLSVYAEKKGDGFAMMRGYDKIIAGRNVLIVEDVLNTYGTVGRVVEAVRAAHGYVVGIGALCDRSNPEVRIHIPSMPRIVSLMTISLMALSKEECLRTGPCSKGIPIDTTLGKGKELLVEKIRA